MHVRCNVLKFIQENSTLLILSPHSNRFIAKYVALPSSNVRQKTFGLNLNPTDSRKTFEQDSVGQELHISQIPPVRHIKNILQTCEGETEGIDGP